MKKIYIIGIMAAIFGIAPANAVTTSYTINPTSIPDLVYTSGYEWGISTATLGATSLSSASFAITTTVSGTTSSTLYIDLIGGGPVAANGFTSTGNNSESGSDFWQTSPNNTYFQIQLGAPTYGTSASPNDNGQLMTYNITGTLTGTALADLNYDLAHNGGFNIGFDPNCTYYSNVTTMSFTYTKSVPDTAVTVLLLGASLLGLEIFRRKFAPAKNQA